MQTSETSTTHPTSIYSPEDFLVKTFQSPINQNTEPKESEGKGRAYGNSMGAYWGKLDLLSSSLKTAQDCLFPDLNTFYATFPPAGIMLNGNVFMRRNGAIRTVEKGFMEWPTPSASDGKIILKVVESYKKYYQNGHQDKLLYQCHLNGMGAIQTIHAYEWMMGFPKDWTNVESTDAVTPS